MRNIVAYLRSGTRSLKTTLALYFIPISIIPTLSVSFYAVRVFEASTAETLVQRARSERDAIVGEIDSLESELQSQARAHAKMRRLLDAVARKDEPGIREALGPIPATVTVRVYSADGKFLLSRSGGVSVSPIDYLSRDGLRDVRNKGETLDRYFTEDNTGFVTILRQLLRDDKRVYGVLEEEYHFGPRDFADIRNRRQVDVILLNPQLSPNGGSFALGVDKMGAFSQKAFQQALKGMRGPSYVEIAGTRYASFLYDLPARFGKQKQWGYLAILLSMNSSDATVTRLKLAIVYLTVLMTLMAMLAIFVFSNRLVKPIVVLVSAMKRVKTGRVEQIPNIDSAYEVEYLVRSFNEMTRNVTATKRALELKLEELRKANSELKQTQATLVQSAKMISLGQIVAGVAHELNNPIAFIYSNMHHLTEYLTKINQMVTEYRASRESLPEDQKRHLEQFDKDLEIDFILKDMVDLTQSCVEGAERTKEIVLGLRTFSRMDESNFRPNDLHEGLRSTVKLLTAELKGRIEVHEEFGDLPLVEGNLSQLNQVFMNLLSNAAQAIEGKGNIWIRTRVDGSHVVIEVEDTGSGMSPETVDKIFDPFFTTKRVGQGTGLGLSIAYGLIQKHHGTITVTSSAGQGTCFTLRLPITQPVTKNV
jgi:two-component system NtrC family sensor kinase